MSEQVHHGVSAPPHRRLKMRGERELYLAVSEGNASARRVYERLGFRVEP